MEVRTENSLCFFDAMSNLHIERFADLRLQFHLLQSPSRELAQKRDAFGILRALIDSETEFLHEWPRKHAESHPTQHWNCEVLEDSGQS
jgi:hypothetical protein